jgi:hypothetical protein
VAFSSKIFNIGKSISGKITSVSSSIFKRRPLNTDTFLKPNTTPIEETLIETNSILSEIQKQLALDFAYRIAKEDDELKDLQKSSEERDSISKKLGVSSSPLGKVTNKAISPIKNIFQSIFKFLLWIGAGFVANKFLTDPSWQKVGGNFLKWVQKHWKWITGIGIGATILSAVGKLAVVIGAIKLLWPVLIASALSAGGMFLFSQGRDGSWLQKKLNKEAAKKHKFLPGIDIHHDPTGERDVGRMVGDKIMGWFNGIKNYMGFDKGGLVRGMGGVDNIPARLSAGEVVMSNDAADLWGRDNPFFLPLIGNKKQTYSKLGRPNKSLPITVLPSINSGSTDTGTVPDSPSDADSVPLVLSENRDNYYVGYMRSQLGIFE